MAAVEDFPEDDALAALTSEIQTPYYEAETIADRLLWPAVDKLWHGGDNWRRQAFPGADLKACAKTTQKGIPVEAWIAADCLLKDLNEIEDWEDQIIHSVTLDIHRELPDSVRDYLWMKMYAKIPEAMMGIAKEETIAKKIISYYFDTDGVGGVDESQRLQDINGTTKWYLHETTHPEQPQEGEETDEEDYLSEVAEPKIREYDLMEIGLGIKVLTRSRKHLRIVEEIKQQPIESH